jgi:NADH-quinone oxidoreductase subunit M
LYQRVFFGTVTNPKNEKLHDLTPREVATFVPLLIMAFWIGLYPKPFFRILEQPVNNLVATVNGTTSKNESTASTQNAAPAAPAAMQVSVIPAAATTPGTSNARRKPSTAAIPSVPAKEKN